MKILFVGDPHLDNRTPLSRLDDYAELTLQKLDKIKEISVEENINIIIFTGDMFDKDNYDQPLSYINKVISKFKEIYDLGIKAYSIIGNHDLRHNKMEYFKQSPLHILFQTGFVKHLDKESVGNIVLYGIDFTEKDKITTLNEELDTNKFNILTMHYATDNTVPYESIGRKEFSNFDLVISGHDHNYYEPSQEGKAIVLRPGSMIRRTKDKYNLERQPLVYIVVIKDTIVEQIREVIINEQEANAVFKAQVFTDTYDFKSTDITKLFTDQYFKKEVVSLKELIGGLPLPITTKTKEKLLKYVEEQGI